MIQKLFVTLQPQTGNNAARRWKPVRENWKCLFSSVGQSTWFVISGSLVRIRQEAQVTLKTSNKGEYQSGQMGQTVNLLVYTFGGSSPSSPTTSAEVAQLIEQQPSKLRVASLSLVFRSNKSCLCSSGVEHFLGKEEVAGSNPAIGSSKFWD